MVRGSQEGQGLAGADGILFDLGVSSPQLDHAERGFSYMQDAPLDMRMSQQGPTAADLVNTLDREELTRILRDYGEEPYAWQIAGKIVAARAEQPILTTLQLAEIVAAAVPPAERRKAKNPARRTFQAIRIAVNSELDALNEGLDAIFDCLAPGGGSASITVPQPGRIGSSRQVPRWHSAAPARRSNPSAPAEVWPRPS